LGGGGLGGGAGRGVAGLGLVVGAVAVSAAVGRGGVSAGPLPVLSATTAGHGARTVEAPRRPVAVNCKHERFESIN
jgi:hypothetical protein